MKVGLFYSQDASVTGHAPGTRRYVTFPAYSAWPTGSWAVTCSTRLSGDVDASNDRRTGTVVVRSGPAAADVGATRILAPAGTIDSTAAIAPACSVYNYGYAAASYVVNLRIGSFYDRSVNVSSHAPGTRRLVSFPSVSAWPRGTWAMTCSTRLTGDEAPANDRATGTVTARVRDVAAAGLFVPASADSGELVSPACSLFNHGSVPGTYTVRMSIGTSYVRTVSVSGHAPGTGRRVAFPPWNAVDPGTNAVTCSTELAGDLRTTNDRQTGTIVVRGTGGPAWPDGWHEVASMPGGVPVKRGGWLALDGDGMIYATRGNKTFDFHVYDPLRDAWTELAPMPGGPSGDAPDKGSKGITDGAGRLFATKGRNTLEFWQYSVAANAWSARADVPAGGGKRVKGGTDMVFVPGSPDRVYLLKGYGCEFYSYEPGTDAWTRLADAPAGVKPKYDKGSWLVYGGGNAIYCHKAKYYGADNCHEFYRYDIGANTWTALPGMPLYGLHGGRIKKKKAKDGGAGAYYDGSIYALKGGNTQQFWLYDAARDTWAETDTIPTNGSTGKKKRVKYGGDLVHRGSGAFFALKGNKTTEFWRYVVPAGQACGRQPEGPGVMAGVTKPDRTVFTVAPNPAGTRTATIRYQLPAAAGATVTVHDAAGRSVLARTVSRARSGTVQLDTRSLAAGIYLVKLEAGDFTATGKLVLQR